MRKGVHPIFGELEKKFRFRLPTFFALCYSLRTQSSTASAAPAFYPTFLGIWKQNLLSKFKVLF